MTAESGRGQAEAQLALARDALLDHLNRGDARHALGWLTGALAQLLGVGCRLQVLAADGNLHWSAGGGSPPPPDADALTIGRVGARLGTLVIAGPRSAVAWSRTLEPVLPTFAALLQQAETAPPLPAAGPPMALMEAALACADTFVWQWDLDSDSWATSTRVWPGWDMRRRRSAMRRPTGAA